MATAPQAEFKLIVAPATGFDAIDQCMVGMGLARGPDTAVTPPILPGEPEFAHWTADAGDVQVHYSFNPVVFLRVLVFSGAEAFKWSARAAAQLPQLDQSALSALLRAADPREVLLGLYAAAELKAIGVIEEVNALRIHRDRRISQSAGRTAEKLGLALLEVGAERLAREQRRHPDRSAVFPRLGDGRVRRETLLWLLHDGHGVNEDVLKVLRAALADPDWQVRITAMLVAARMKATAVWLAIREMELPGTDRRGLDFRHRSLVAAARKAVLAELAGEPRLSAHDERTRLMLHLRHVVCGEDDGIRDEARDWLEGWLQVPDDQASAKI